jgi:ribonuclease E
VTAAVTGTRATVASRPTAGDAAPARRTAPLVAARSIAHVQRSSLDSPAPALRPASASPRQLEPAPAAGAAASLVHRATVPFPQSAAAAAALLPASGPTLPVLARQPAPIAEPTRPAPITVAREQAEPEPSASAAPLLQVQAEAPAQVQRAEAAEAAPAAAAGGQSAQSDEEMAARLYDRIRSRLRDELLVDRERAGLVTDVR